MSMDTIVTKFVDFQKYCNLCKNKDVKETEDPCNECLEYGARENTTKPIHFDKKE